MALSTTIAFLLPALAMGMISPVTAKMAIARGKGVGVTLGSVYAWGAAGSIMGTFAAGFWLIAALGARGVVIAVACGLGLIGLALGPKRIMHAIWVAALAGMLLAVAGTGRRLLPVGLPDGPAGRPGCAGGEEAAGILDSRNFQRYCFSCDSQYQFVQVILAARRPRRRGRSRIGAGFANRHCFQDMDDPTHLDTNSRRCTAS